MLRLTDQAGADSISKRDINHLRDGLEQQRRDKILEEQFHNPLPGYPFYW